MSIVKSGVFARRGIDVVVATIVDPHTMLTPCGTRPAPCRDCRSSLAWSS